MKDTHIIEAFADWSAGTMDRAAREHVDQHLSSCPDCAAYYQKMNALMDAMSPDALPKLEADPYLPTRVRALAEAHDGVTRRAGIGRLRVAFTSVAFVFALAIGVYVGHGAATSVVASSGVEVAQSDASTDVFDAYYDALSQSGFADEWSQWDGEDSR